MSMTRYKKKTRNVPNSTPALDLLFGGKVTRDGYRHGFFGNKNNYGSHILVLSGGGIDSYISALLFKIANTAPYSDDAATDQSTEALDVSFVFFDYGQSNADFERRAVQTQARLFSKYSKVYEIKDGLTSVLRDFNRNPLSNRDQVKSDAPTIDKFTANDDYVPNRNARFLAQAAGLAEVIGADTLIIGAVGSVNQDNSMAFLEAAQATFKQSNRDIIPNIYAPFVMLTKAMVAKVADEITDVKKLPDVSLSCFNPIQYTDTDVAGSFTAITQCGVCRSCASLKQAFKFAGVEDPYVYVDTLSPGIPTVSSVEMPDGLNKQSPKKLASKKGWKKPEVDYTDDEDDLDDDED